MHVPQHVRKPKTPKADNPVPITRPRNPPLHLRLFKSYQCPRISRMIERIQPELTCLFAHPQHGQNPQAQGLPADFLTRCFFCI